MAYRELLGEQPQAVKRKWWGRIVCLFWWHDWMILRTNRSKAIGLAEFHPLAGRDAICQRCGKIWLDADDPLFRGIAEIAKAALPPPIPKQPHFRPRPYAPSPSKGTVILPE